MTKSPPRIRVSVKRLIVVLLVLGGLLALRPLADDFLRTTVEEVFTQGTGCTTTIRSAKLQFIPLGAAANDAQIRCSGESANGGFRAAHVSIKLNPLKLVTKTVFLEDLRISGARVTSRGTDSSLIRTVEFVTTPPKQRPQNRAWHSFISSGWKVELSGLEISSAEEADFDSPAPIGREQIWDEPELVIAFDDYELSWKDVRFAATHTERKFDFTRLFARAGGFGVRRGAGGGVPFGAVDAGVSISHGVLSVLHAYTSYRGPAGSAESARLDAEGSLDIRGREYNLAVAAEMQPEFLQELLPESDGLILQHGISASARADVSGELADPTLVGLIKVAAAEPLTLFRRKACAINEAEAKFRLNQDLLHLYDVQLADLIKSSDVSLRLVDDFAFTAELSYTVDRSSALVDRCLTSAEEEHQQWFDLTLKNAVANSRGIIAARGTLVPLTASGQVDSQFHRSDATDRATLNSKFDFSDNRLKLRLRERGDVAQVRGSPLPGETRGAAQATRFQTTTHANIDLDVIYDAGAGTLQIPRLHLKRYPLGRLLARLAPFLPEAALENAGDFVTEESLLDLDAHFSKPGSGEPLEGGGSAAAYELNYAGVPILSASTDFVLSQRGTSFEEISAASAAGELRGALQIGANGVLEGEFRVDEADLQQIPWWHESMPDLEASLQGFVEFGGTLENPELSGEVQVQSATEVDSALDLVSSISFKTRNGVLHGSAKLFGQRASASWSLPLGDSSTESLIVKIEAANFPVSVLLPVEVRGLMSAGEDGQEVGMLTGSLHYEAEPDEILYGSGQALIERLSISTPSARIENIQPLRIDISQGTVQIPDVRLMANDKELALRGSISTESGWNLDITSNWDLGALTSMIEPIEQLSGDLNLAARLRGPIEEPELSAVIRVNRGTVSAKVGQTFIGADDLTIEAEVKNGNLMLHDLSARVGEGTIAARGEVAQLLDSAGRNGTIAVVMTGISLQPTEDLFIRFSGYIDLVLRPGAAPLLGGEVEILNAIYERDVSLRAVIRKLLSLLKRQPGKQVRRGVGMDQGSVELDLRIHADESLLIESDFLKATMRGDLRLQGTASQPLIEGEVNVLDGSFGLSSSKFDILSGSIKFPENSLIIDPDISLAAETIIQTSSREEHRVLLTIGGTARNPQVSMATDSGMSEREIVGLLNIGGSSDNFSLLSWDEGRDDYTYVELLNPRSDIKLSDRLKGLLGFSRLEIESRRRVEKGDVVARVSGSREVTPDVSLTLYSDVGDSNEQGAKLDYELTPYVSTFGEWRSVPETATESSTGSVGGGIIFRKSFPGTGLIPKQLMDD